MLWATLPKLLPVIQWMKSNITTSLPFNCYYWQNLKKYSNFGVFHNQIKAQFLL